MVKLMDLKDEIELGVINNYNLYADPRTIYITTTQPVFDSSGLSKHLASQKHHKYGPNSYL